MDVAFVSIALVGAFGAPWLAGRCLLGPLMAAGWRRLYGEERTEHARAWILGIATAWMVLLYALILRGPYTLGWLGASSLGICLSYMGLLGLWEALAPLTLETAPRRPLLVERDHDGLQVTLTARSALLAALVVGSLPLWPVAWLGWRLLPRPSASLRLRSEVLEVGRGEGRVCVRLFGLRVRHETSWTGTPEICLSQGDQHLRIGVGGHDPAEVTWVMTEIRAAAARAPSVERVREVPVALRRLVEPTVHRHQV